MKLTRRSFLTRTGVAAFALGASPQRVSKMKFGLTTYQWGFDWDIPTLIANCTRAQAFAVELRVSLKYAHGVELDTSEAKRREVKKRFSASPVRLLGLATSERFDATDPGKLNAAIESAKAYAKLSYDVGGSGFRVFPNDFHIEVPHEKTIAQIAKALDDVGKFAADFGQQVRLENHGSAGRLTTLAKIFEQVTQPNVRVKLNSDPHDAEGGEFARNFALVKDRLGYDLHCHMLNPSSFPYQLQADLLIDLGWDGWWLVEQGEKVPDRVQAMIELHQQFDKLVATSLKRA
jgi:hypothetical protein